MGSSRRPVPGYSALTPRTPPGTCPPGRRRREAVLALNRGRGETMRQSLGIKLAVPLLATLALGFGTLLAVSLQAQSAHLRAQAQKRTEAVSEVFSANLRTVMLTGDGVLLDRLLAELRTLKTQVV